MINWHLKHFNELLAGELYHILDLRNKIFVVEQNCIYRDTDNKDQNSYHVFATIKDEVIAYARIVEPGLSYPEPSIGRVCCAKKFRELGMGKELMTRAIKACRKIYTDKPIRISAQLYLKGFYENLGFKPKGEIYLEDNIEHIGMLLE